MTQTDPLIIPFRPYLVLSRQLVRMLGGIVLGGVLGALSVAPHVLQSHRFIVNMSIYLGAIVLFVIGRRIYIWKKGGIPPLRFCDDDVELPVHINSRRIRKIPYEDILSVTIVGKKQRARLILDTKKRAFVYPLREFADTDAANTIKEALHQRIIARQDGAVQWEQMEKRQALADHFAGFKPWATWILIISLIVIYLGQLFWLSNGDAVFGMLDLGANVYFLVWQGEWFRLITSNLLHASPMHLFNNALFAFIVGALVERQIGTRRFVLLILVTGVLSALSSAAWLQWGRVSSTVFSVGVSGVLFGMLGAQAVLNRRFAAQLPGGIPICPSCMVDYIRAKFPCRALGIPGSRYCCPCRGTAFRDIYGLDIVSRADSDFAAPALGAYVESCIGWHDSIMGCRYCDYD